MVDCGGHPGGFTPRDVSLRSDAVGGTRRRGSLPDGILQAIDAGPDKFPSVLHVSRIEPSAGTVMTTGCDIPPANAKQEREFDYLATCVKQCAFASKYGTAVTIQHEGKAQVIGRPRSSPAKTHVAMMSLMEVAHVACIL